MQWRWSWQICTDYYTRHASSAESKHLHFGPHSLLFSGYRSFAGVKGPGSEEDHATLSQVDDKNQRAIPSSPPSASIVRCFLKPGYNSNLPIQNSCLIASTLRTPIYRERINMLDADGRDGLHWNRYKYTEQTIAGRSETSACRLSALGGGGLRFPLQS